MFAGCGTSPWKPPNCQASQQIRQAAPETDLPLTRGSGFSGSMLVLFFCFFVFFFLCVCVCLTRSLGWPPLKVILLSQPPNARITNVSHAGLKTPKYF